MSVSLCLGWRVGRRPHRLCRLGGTSCLWRIAPGSIARLRERAPSAWQVGWRADRRTTRARLLNRQLRPRYEVVLEILVEFDEEGGEAGHPDHEIAVLLGLGLGLPQHL
jgi:hypothetical protein